RASMLHTLRRCGVLAAPAPAAGIAAATGVAPPYRALVGRWLDVLTSAGLVHRDGDLVAPADPAAPGPDWDALAARWRAAVGGDGTVAYARRNADALPDLLRGRGSPVEVLFPAGSLDTARALYRESVTARYQHAAVAAAVAALCADHPPGAVPRLLEIGTGTGATTDAVLPALAGRPVDYLLTDVSRAFLAPLLAARGDRVRGARYDIDAPPGPQGLAPGSFDVIIGGGVLNAARDTDASLRHLADLLAPGGHLVVSEPTTEEHWIMTSQALLLTPPADARAVDRTTFLTATRWRESYARAGLALVAALPPPGHPLAALGHHVHVLRTADPLTPPSASSGHDLAAP
ncbi:MAG TPA: class I SAM-dependent methyltransferase, partial [Pilimelia sp.]|nr:class I SAM-dependent methyltransferase [Pilimelia sp.]